MWASTKSKNSNILSIKYTKSLTFVQTVQVSRLQKRSLSLVCIYTLGLITELIFAEDLYRLFGAGSRSLNTKLSGCVVSLHHCPDHLPLVDYPKTRLFPSIRSFATKGAFTVEPWLSKLETCLDRLPPHITSLSLACPGAGDALCTTFAKNVDVFPNIITLRVWGSVDSTTSGFLDFAYNRPHLQTLSIYTTTTDLSLIVLNVGLLPKSLTHLEISTELAGLAHAGPMANFPPMLEHLALCIYGNLAEELLGGLPTTLLHLKVHFVGPVTLGVSTTHFPKSLTTLGIYGVHHTVDEVCQNDHFFRILPPKLSRLNVGHRNIDKKHYDMLPYTIRMNMANNLHILGQNLCPKRANCSLCTGEDIVTGNKWIVIHGGHSTSYFDSYIWSDHISPTEIDAIKTPDGGHLSDGVTHLSLEVLPGVGNRLTLPKNLRRLTVASYALDFELSTIGTLPRTIHTMTLKNVLCGLDVNFQDMVSLTKLDFTGDHLPLGLVLPTRLRILKLSVRNITQQYCTAGQILSSLPNHLAYLVLESPIGVNYDVGDEHVSKLPNSLTAMTLSDCRLTAKCLAVLPSNLRQLRVGLSRPVWWTRK